MEDIYIDINCDMGEGIGNEKDIMPLISSCNIACGGHIGDRQSMCEVVSLAKTNGVKIGAHPSYPDKENFGRVSIDISADDLTESIYHQMNGFVAILEKEKINLHHIKPHGALYYDLAKDTLLAQAFLKGVERYREQAFIYVPFNSILAREALAAGFKIKYEAFGDRNYQADGSLVPRGDTHAVIENSQEVLGHIVRMVLKKQVKLPDGKQFKILADTYCIHGDNPFALQILAYLSESLSMYNIQINT